MRRLGWGTLLAVALATLGVLAWSGHRAVQVRGELTAARARLAGIQSEATTGDLKAAEAGLSLVRTHLDRAADRSSGPTWAVAARLPFIGGSFRAVRRTARAGQVLGADVMPEMTQLLEELRTRPPIKDGTVSLDQLARIEERLTRAARGSARARTLVSAREAHLLPVVASGVRESRSSIGRLDDGLQASVRALEVAPTLLGSKGPRRYFIAVQNNAEARAIGGLIGQFALVTADHGRITLEHAGSDSELHKATSPGPSDPEAAAIWTRAGSTLAWQDVGLTPHFPDAARNITGLWHAQGGPPLDGVIALDPLVMSELLKLTGPVAFADGSTVDAAHIVDFVGRDEYVRFPDNARRHEILRLFSDTLFHRVLAVDDAPGLVQALGRAASSGHLFMWSAHPAEQAELAATVVGGALPAEDTPYLSVLSQNAGGNKLDYYLHRTVRVTPAGGGFVRVRVTLRNTAGTGLPPIAVGRLDHPKPPVPYGQSKVLVSFYGAKSTEVFGVFVNGKAAGTAFDKDHGHLLGTLNLELPRDTDVTVTVLLSQPAGVLTYRQQPLARPDTLQILVPHRVVGR